MESSPGIDLSALLTRRAFANPLLSRQLDRLPFVIGPPASAGATGVQPGGEGFWFPGSNRTAVLALHGWTGSPYETRPIGEALAECGIPVLGIRLPGHGTHPQEMHAYGWRDWLGAARLALGELLAEGRHVVIAGQSMGGLLALALAMEFRDQPRLTGIVTLAAPVWIVGPHVRTLDHLRRVWPPRKSLIDVNDPTHRDSIVSYRRVHARSVLELLDLSRKVRRRLRHVRQPILVTRGQLDQVVHPVNARIVHDRVSSSDRSLRIYPRSGHIVPLDFDAGTLFDDIEAFVRRLDR